MFQYVIIDLKIWKKNKSSFFFNVFWNFFVLSKKHLNRCVFPISYICLHVISYKSKCVLFHLNMLRLFQEINILFFFEIKLVSNKNVSFKYIIQGFNSHLFCWFNVYPP
jgi:hypothetical protein